MTTELKPCPFCGGKAKLSIYRICEDAMGASVKCTSCLMTTTEYEDAYAPKADAIAAWNTRATPSPVPELVRYEYNPYSNHGCSTELMEVNAKGEYVRYGQAERIIADQANRADVAEYKLGVAVNATHQMLINRAEAAEAELAEIEKQVPVAVLRFDRSAGHENEMPKVVSCNWQPDGEYKVYAHPVADREAETIESLCEATQLFCDAYTDESSDPNHYILLMQTAWENAQEPLRALSGKEPV